jgi:hypothetical protein
MPGAGSGFESDQRPPRLPPLVGGEQLDVVEGAGEGAEVVAFVPADGGGSTSFTEEVLADGGVTADHRRPQQLPDPRPRTFVRDQRLPPYFRHDGSSACAAAVLDQPYIVMYGCRSAVLRRPILLS